MVKANIRLLFICSLMILGVALTACSHHSEFEKYEGEALNIAVVGEPPTIRENQVSFSRISFDDLASNKPASYDGVIITSDNLEQAAESRYADVYRNATVPFFFMSTTSLVPFINKDVNYEDAWDWTAGNMYAVGVSPSPVDGKWQSWGYGLYNDKKTDKAVEDIYSRIFKTIDEQSL